MSSSSTSSSDEEIRHVERKKYRVRTNYLEEYNDREFFDRFRFTKDFVVAICEQIEDVIAPPTNR